MPTGHTDNLNYVDYCGRPCCVYHVYTSTMNWSCLVIGHATATSHRAKNTRGRPIFGSTKVGQGLGISHYRGRVLYYTGLYRVGLMCVILLPRIFAHIADGWCICVCSWYKHNFGYLRHARFCDNYSFFTRIVLI